jgi:hypothetical protein
MVANRGHQQSESPGTPIGQREETGKLLRANSRKSFPNMTGTHARPGKSFRLKAKVELSQVMERCKHGQARASACIEIFALAQAT